MPGRRTRQHIPNVYNLHIPLGVCRHSAGAYAVLETLVTHLAYNREQCHHTYTQLDTFAQACRQQQEQQKQQHAGRAKRLKSSTRKALKYYDRLSGLLQLAASIPFHELGGLAVTVLLGTSVQRPREVYCLHLPAAMDTPGAAAAAAAPTPAALSAATRKLMLRLLAEHNTVPEWEEPTGPTKMWLLFQAPAGSLCCAPPGFTAKRAYSISLKKAFQVNILTCNQQPAPNSLCALGQQQQQPPQQQQQQQQQAIMAAHGDASRGLEQLSQQLSRHMTITDAGASGPDVVWYQASIHVKGLKQPTAST